VPYSEAEHSAKIAANSEAPTGPSAGICLTIKGGTPGSWAGFPPSSCPGLAQVLSVSSLAGDGPPMARPRMPTEVLELRGALLNYPERHRLARALGRTA
jgi:hypothetical protein